MVVEVPMVPGRACPCRRSRPTCSRHSPTRHGSGPSSCSPESEYSVGELQPLVGIESSHLSQQLGVLRRAGLVTTRKDGSSVIYAIKDPLVAELLAVAKRFLLNSLAETRDLLADLDAAVAGE